MNVLADLIDSRMVKISNSLLKKLGLIVGESKGFDDPRERLPPDVIGCQLTI